MDEETMDAASGGAGAGDVRAGSLCPGASGGGGCCPGASIEYSGTCGETLTWTLDSDGLLTISGEGEMENYANYDAAPWHSRSNSVQTLIIENGVTSIGDYAFNYCRSLTSVTIPEGVTSIGDSAFSSCSSLTSVTIPEGVTSIGDSAFSSCSSLTSVTIPEGVASIGSYAFSNCSSLTSVTISEGVTSIGDYAFSWCNSLTSVAIPEGVTSIGDHAFYDCSNLTSVAIPEGVTSIGDSAFSNCNSLTSVTISEGVTSIGQSAFQHCNGLTSVTIPESVTSIGSSAFSGCSSLTSAGPIGGGYNIEFGWTNTISSGCLNKFPYLTSVTIPEGVTSIDQAAFSGCSSLTSVTIPEGVTSIGNYAFYGCSSLTSVTIPEGVTSIGGLAFSGCSGLTSAGPIGGGYDIEFGWTKTIPSGCLDQLPYLTSVTIPEGVTSIGDHAFYDCSSLTSVTIPEGVASIGSFAFENCSSLTRVTIPESVNKIRRSVFENCSSLTSVTIPEGVISIGWDAFSGCSSLTSVTIPEGVTSIESSAFKDCSSLTSVTIPEGVTSIDTSLFSNCTSLVSVELPQSVTLIHNSAFSNCTSLTAISLPQRISRICESAFEGCTGLKKITIPKGVRTIDQAAFRGCTGLTDVTMFDGVTSIGEQAFYGCTSLTGVRIPQGVETIAHSTFRNCSQLALVTIPKSVTAVAAYAFDGCDALTQVRYEGAKIDWESISIKSHNDPLLNAAKEYEQSNSGAEIIRLAGSNRYATAIQVAEELKKHLHEDSLGTGVVLEELSVYTTPSTESNVVKTLTEGEQVNVRRTTQVMGAQWAYIDEPATGWILADGVRMEIKFDSIIVASGNAFPDALAGSYLATTKNAPILLSYGKGGKYATLDDANIAYIQENLVKGGTVYILGGTEAVPELYDEALKGYHIRRLAGANRFATNLAILEEAGVPARSEILVCSASNFADSLSASATGKPILLVWDQGNRLYGDQPAYLSGLSGCSFTILGGENAVSLALETELSKYGKVNRLAGLTRLETTVKVAETYFQSPNTVALAFAGDYPDGLCGGVLAHAMNAPLILTMNNMETQATRYVSANDLQSGVVLGGTNALPESSVTKIFN